MSQFVPRYAKVQHNYQNEDVLSCFGEKPTDMSDEQFALARETAEKLKGGARLPKNVEQSAFYFYYMNLSWSEIANKLEVPVGMLLYTAIFYGWFERKKMATSTRAGDKVTRADAAAIDLITDTLVATAAIYKTQLAEVIKNPAEAKNCTLIPKNFKDMQILLQMLQSLQVRDPETLGMSRQPTINVNVANLTGGQNQTRVGVESIDAVALPEAPEDETIQMLQLLEKMKINR
jgi:hypothetical protein